MTRTERVQQMAERMARARYSDFASFTLDTKRWILDDMLPLAEMAVSEMAEEASLAYEQAYEDSEELIDKEKWKLHHLQSRGLKD
jgi:hypothetical protein